MSPDLGVLSFFVGPAQWHSFPPARSVTGLASGMSMPRPRFFNQDAGGSSSAILSASTKSGGVPENLDPARKRLALLAALWHNLFRQVSDRVADKWHRPGSDEDRNRPFLGWFCWPVLLVAG